MGGKDNGFYRIVGDILRGSRTGRILLSLVIYLLLAGFFQTGEASLDYPHFGINGIGCDSCHFVYGGEPSLLPPWTSHTPQDIDDTAYNTLCWSCHNDVDAPYARTHSSLQIDTSYGDWTVECRVCHNPHFQQQFRTYGSDSYIESGISSAVTSTSLTKTGAGWNADEFAGMVLVPDLSQLKYNYKILSNSTDTLSIEGPVNLEKTSAGDTFAIVYGKLIKETITLDNITDPTPPKTGNKAVRFFRATGSKSYSDGDGTYDGICEVCHTLTTHFRNDGSGSDQLHSNVGSPAGTDCMSCHDHTRGFAHGDVSGGSGCEECHGHDPGYGGFTGGKGTYRSHSTHTENDADDIRGPDVGCDACHDTGDFPSFKSGTDSNGDGKYSLDETDVCDGCHSSGGTYDGVNDVDLGAKYGNGGELKYNWTNRVYNDSDNLNLQSGMEKWCATCHDESPSQIQSVDAPNITGDEDGAYTYGTGWGYYKTGHGLGSGQWYPFSGGLIPGAGKQCDACHDYSLNHIDGDNRTFDCSDGCDTVEYRQSYRLKLVDGLSPLEIPRPRRPSAGILEDDFRLCFQSGCHTSDKYFLQSTPMTTLFRDEVDGDYPDGGDTPMNAHQYHLDDNWTGRFYPDWNGNGGSQITCINCHNVHGSTQLSMVRDGKLVNKEPGLVVYYNDGAEAPGPSSTTLADSAATAFIPGSSINICANCHGAGGYYKYDRVPPGPQQAPVLAWTGESNFTSDGVNPDSAVGGSSFVFRVEYTDSNMDDPKYIQLWVDENDNNSYEAGEKYDMVGVDPVDRDYSDGKVYRKSVNISKTGDGSLKYRFFATDGKDNASGDPVSDSTVVIANNAPVLSWAGDDSYADDGVNPNSGSGGSSFVFRVSYKDKDNEVPSSIQVWIDEDDNSTYEGGEKYVMSETDSADQDLTDGKLYTVTRTIAYAGDGSLTYRFYASDGTDAATGVPVSNSSLSVTDSNTAPVLSWTGELEYVSDGANPDSGTGCIDYVFRVKYTDNDNGPPSSMQVWIDENDNSSYEAGEKYDMTEVDSGDTDYSNGKLYSSTRSVAYAGDGSINYRFYASDGAAVATGTPASNIAFTVADELEVPGEYGTIQAAINAASNGDYVCVSSGTYSENINFSSKSLTLRSVSGAVLTVIEGSGSNAAVVTFNSGEGAGSVIDGFTIDNQASDTSTRGLYIENSSPTVRNSIIQGNTATTLYGGGVYIIGGGATIENTVIGSEDYPNSAFSAGGINYQDSAAGTLSISDSTIVYNSASWNGGGIYLSNITNTTVISNTSISNNSNNVRYGGGIRADDAPLTITDSYIDNNSSNWSGGGIYLGGTGLTTTTVENTRVSGNSVAFGAGGGIYLTGSDSTLLIRNSTISNNTTTNTFDGGGLDLVGTSQTVTVDNSTLNQNIGRLGGGINFAASDSTLSISDSFITSNTGFFGPGGLNLNGGTAANEVTVERSVIAGNNAQGAAGSAGGVRVTSGAETFISATFTNCTVTGNKSDLSYGGGFWVGGAGTTVDIINCTVSGNTAAHGAAISYSDDGSATLNVKNSILWGDRQSNTSGTEIRDISSSANISYSNIRQGGYEGSGNMNTDPLFISAMDYSLAPTAEGNYHLLPDSPVIDKGTVTEAPSDDIDGNSRPQLTGYDMGSDEVLNTSGANSSPSLSWTGETNYLSDGIDPDSGPGGADYEFRISYTDADNESPGAIQIWVDENDNDAYESGEKHSMTETDGGDTDYSDGKLYSKTLSLQYDGDGSVKYRFYASDGSSDAIGSPASDNTLTLTNTAPSLAWTGEAGYTTDGVDPDNDASGSNFEFRIKYTDSNNDDPSTIQVWIDENDNSTYEGFELYNMTAVDGGDTDFADGKLYTKTLSLSKDGDNAFNYRFYASDGSADATGTPVSDSTVSVTNNIPSLAWTGEANYTTDGVDPDSGAGGGNFIFRVSYTDEDNEAPSSIQVWIDENDNASYEAGEKYALTVVDGGDTDYTDGKLYTKTHPLAYAGDGTLNYRFFASDGSDNAAGPPASDSQVTVTGAANNAPVLSWTGESGYTSDGIQPDSGAGCVDFTFRVTYTDDDDDAPASIQVWVDENDNSAYEEGEKYTLTETDAGDTDYTDGKFYTKTMNIAYAGNGTLNYQLYAYDGIANASGPPTSDKTVVISDSRDVPGEYGTIQLAINAASNGEYVCVSSGTYSENIDFSNKAVTVMSVNGAGSTTIQGATSSTNQAVVTFDSGEGAGSVLDGFTIDNQAQGYTGSRGIYISSSSPTIRNSVVQGNTLSTAHSNYRGAGIYITGAAGGATIENTTIGGSLANKNDSYYGAGICFENSTTGALTITGSTISFNNGYYGGGVYLANNANQVTITDTSISNNTTWNNSHAGGMYISNSPVSITGGTISDNVSTQDGAGLYVTGADADVTINNTTFDGNSGRRHGGIQYTPTLGTLDVTDSMFTSNTASSGFHGGAIYSTRPVILTGTTISGSSTGWDGGGLYLEGASASGTIKGSTFSGNSARYGGGLGISGTSSATITNSNITGNYATTQGGGIINWGGTLDIINSTIAGNYTASNGGGLRDSGTTTVKNSIFWGNLGGPQISGSTTVTYSDVEGGFTGTGNMNTDPSFVNFQQAGSGSPTAAGDFHLQSGSLVVDQGTSTGAPTDDIDGDSRPLGSGIDMGADEKE